MAKKPRIADNGSALASDKGAKNMAKKAGYYC